MHLLVTGGCGFIGSHFVRQRLAEREMTVRKLINLDKLTYAGSLANLHGCNRDPRHYFVQGDIADADLMAHLLEAHQITTVVNFAAETHVDRSIDAPEPFLQTNVIGTQRLLAAACSHWRKLPGPLKEGFRFLHVSTDEVYGTLAPTHPACTEASPFAPNSPYAASKAAGDHLVRSYFRTYDLPTLIARPSNTYGPRQFPEKLIPLMILNALEERPLPVYGDGAQVREWLYVDDLIRALWLFLSRGPPGTACNFGGGQELTNLSVVKHICAALEAQAPRQDGTSYSAQISFVTDRPGHDRRYALNSTKANNELAWRPEEAFPSGLAKTLAWYLTHREWCAEISARKYRRDRLGQPFAHP